jgi:hypothetical protein
MGTSVHALLQLYVPVQSGNAAGPPLGVISSPE